MPPTEHYSLGGGTLQFRKVLDPRFSLNFPCSHVPVEIYFSYKMGKKGEENKRELFA